MATRRERLEAQIGTFVRQYGRKKRPGQGEPNDRSYDRRTEQMVKRMGPLELDALMRDEDNIAPGGLVRGVGYSTSAVLRGDRALLLVVHENNGDWLLLDGGPYDATDGVAIHAAHMFDERHELSALSDLPLGWAAERVSEDSEWQRSPWVDEHGEDK